MIALGIVIDDPEISSGSLARVLKVTQKTGYHILRRLHEAAGDLLAEPLHQSDPDYQVIADWPAYRVGRDGSVWTRWRPGRGGRLGLKWRIMNPSRDKDGYRVVRFYRGDGTWKQLRVSRLICAAFHGDPLFPELEVRHLDGNNRNDASENLAWGTSAENSNDTKRHGTQPFGEQHHNATLSDTQVAEICALKGKRLQREVAAAFGTTQSYVSDIWSGRRRVALTQ